ncbi:MAG: acyclic terpene utilization AtuA family protein [Haliea sp.]
MNSDKIVRVANAQGFWGDSSLAPSQLVEGGPVDYLTFDYLAEVTMSIMQKQKMRDPSAGYARDFVSMLTGILPACKDKGIKIIANAGGINPKACLEAVEAVIVMAGLQGLRVGIVEGDDILDDLDALCASGETFSNLESGEALETVRAQITSANVYIGAMPIVEALQQGADIIITGRVADPSLALAPLIFEFDWSFDDYNKLAAGTVMGHIIECGPQATGGNYSNWREVPGMARIGYPVAEAKADGSFVITKHENTGGLINEATVTSQLLYELADPKNYLSPDCVADFTSINLSRDGDNRIAISGIKGRAPTATYKVSMSYQRGYKILATLCISGPDAIDKAHVLFDMVFERMAMHGATIPENDRFLELFGTNILYKGLVACNEHPHEIMMRIGARGNDAKALNILGTEIAPLLTAGPPGITGYAGGRARSTEVIGYWPTLINRNKVNTRVTVKEV